MEYRVLDENGTSFLEKKINNSFLISTKVNDEVIVFGRKKDRNDNDKNIFLGKFNFNNFIKKDENIFPKDNILEGFSPLDPNDDKSARSIYKNTEDSLLFMFSKEKTDFFDSIKLEINNKEQRFHCLGDIFEFEYHWIEADDVMNTMSNCVTRRLPVNRDGRTIPYICMDHFFKDNKEAYEFILKCKCKYNEILENNSGDNAKKLINKAFKEIAEEYMENKKDFIFRDKKDNKLSFLEDKDIVIENLIRFFCVGCLSKEAKKTTKNYILTVIDSSDNIRFWNANQPAIDYIFLEYEKNGGEEQFGCIEKFLATNDVIIKKISDKEISINFVPTKFKNLKGTILAPNPKYLITSNVVDWLAFINKFGGKISDYFDLKKFSSPISVIDITNKSRKFREISSNDYYKNIKFEKIENDYNKDILDFIEI